MATVTVPPYGSAPGMYTFNDLGWKAVSVDPRNANSGVAPTAGIVYGCRFPYRTAIGIGDTINMSNYIFQAGTGTGLANCYIAPYHPTTKTLLATSTTDQATSWGSTGQKDYTFTATAAKAAGLDIMVAFLVGTQNATTGVQLGRWSNNVSAQMENGRNYLTTPIFFSADTGLSALPATLGTLTANANQFFVGIY